MDPTWDSKRRFKNDKTVDSPVNYSKDSSHRNLKSKKMYFPAKRDYLFGLRNSKKRVEDGSREDCNDNQLAIPEKLI